MFFPLISDLKTHIWWWKRHKLDGAWVTESLLGGELLTYKNAWFKIYLSKREILTSQGIITWGVFYHSSKNYPNIMLNSFLVIGWVSARPWGLGSCNAAVPLGLEPFPDSQLSDLISPISMLHPHLVCRKHLPWSSSSLDRAPWQICYLSACSLSFQLLCSHTTYQPDLPH